MSSGFYDKVMVVAHPDDEALWGGDALAQEKGWMVLCLTNGGHPARAKVFHRAMDLFGSERMIFDFPDYGMKDYSESERAEICKVIYPFVNSTNVKKVVTHGPDGEYGHLAHKLISQYVKESLQDVNKLHYFSFSDTPQKQVSQLKQAAFDLYFTPPKKRFFRKWIQFFKVFSRFSVKAVLKFLRIKAYDLSPFRSHVDLIFKTDEGVAVTDLEHCDLSRYEKVVHHLDYKNVDQLLDKVYSARRPPQNAEEVYLRNKALFDRHPDRKYLVTQYLPSCVGKTLGVGCHLFNQFDYCCLPNPRDYETIDSNSKWSIYGSPYKHTTGDFMEYKPDYGFDHIVLFGVMGIPTESVSDEDRYSLYNRDHETIKHVDELLNMGGTVLFGPDFSIDQSKTVAEKIGYWDNFFKNDQILKNKYELVKQFRTDLNYVIVCQKKV